ncbi:glutathione S-transferase [Rhodotorula diobovata]|uniref:Glutathione S-transferase n=1 Tax=Rhodotorula diobovata TaxID=5288 RepID=A0A5C5G081_9BASI|nr:glutathione S-transferase [Rhodotorula diobovata]
MTDTSSDSFKLIYHAGIPGRGEFPRLFLEATGTPYEDTALTVGQDAVKPYLDGSFEGSDSNPLPFAPPVLKHGSVVISQTSNILLYLATHVSSPIELDAGGEDGEPASKKAKASALSVDDPKLFHAQELALTILDLNNEIHDTHHPIAVSAYYEEFKDEAFKRAGDFRKNRLPKFFKHFEDNLQRSTSGYLLSSGPSHADLCLFQVYDGLLFAFPKLMAKVGPEYAKVTALYERVKAAPRIKAYLESDRRQQYSMGIFRHYPELDEQE